MDMNKKDHRTTSPKRNLKTRSYDMDMNKKDHITTLPKRGLKTRSYNMDMNKKDLKRLSKSQLIKLLLKQEKSGQAQKQIANEFENSIVPQPKQEESLAGNSVNSYKDLIIEPPEQFRDKQKKRRPSPIPEPEPLNDFDNNIFQTENTKSWKIQNH